jgi:phosphatidylglycerol---prolipoprotein diacylglyceryl transferase
MLSVNIDPIVFSVGHFEIRYYGLVFVVGILLVYSYLKWKKVLEEEELDKFMLYLVLGMFIGSRLLGIVSQNPSALLRNPLEFFMVWRGGMSFFGGFLGALIGSYFVLKERLLKVGDFVVVPLIFSLGLGRLANFVNQELVGTVTNVVWCFNFLNNEGCRHPYQLYAAASHFLLFGILYWLSRKVRRKGEVFWNFVVGYGGLRFVTDFFRENPKVLGLTGWQWASILFVVVGVYHLIKLRKINLEEER